MIDLLAAPGDPLLEQAVADVSNLVLAGLDVGFVGSWLVEHAPEHFATFSEIAQDALRP